MGCFLLLKEKWRKFWNLYKEIRKANENKIECAFLDFCVFWKTCSTILRANCKMWFTKKEKNEYKYYYKGNLYRIKLNKNINFESKLVEAFDSNEKDITDIIKMYAGPNEDFHNMKISPKMLNLEKVIIRVLDQEVFEINESIFEDDQTLII